MLIDMMQAVEKKAGVAAPPSEPRRLAEADEEVVQQLVARLRRQVPPCLYSLSRRSGRDSPAPPCRRNARLGAVTWRLPRLCGREVETIWPKPPLAATAANGRDHVERYFREIQIPRIAPVSPQLILSHIAERVLGLPKSY